MKHLIMALAAVMIGGASAQAEELLGYVNLNLQGEEFFVAAHLANDKVTAVFSMNEAFDDAQKKTMMSCMAKKQTHVIRILRGTIETKGGPIRTVRCVEAQGFLTGWREVVRNSEFR